MLLSILSRVPSSPCSPLAWCCKPAASHTCTHTVPWHGAASLQPVILAHILLTCQKYQHILTDSHEVVLCSIFTAHSAHIHASYLQIHAHTCKYMQHTYCLFAGISSLFCVGIWSVCCQYFMYVQVSSARKIATRIDTYT